MILFQCRLFIQNLTDRILMKLFTPKIILISSLIILICGASLGHAGTFRPVQGKRAMVVTAEVNASRVGLDILKAGGNAIDAAVGVAFTLAVTYPSAGNIGGGGFIVYRTADDSVYCLDFREKAPLRAHSKMYLDAKGEVISDLSTSGYLASGVPGTVDGLWQAHQRFGQLKWANLLKPAIDLARKGFILDASAAGMLQDALPDLQKFPPSRKRVFGGILSHLPTKVLKYFPCLRRAQEVFFWQKF